MSQHDRYISPFSTRAEMKQGLTNITPEMVAELEAHVDDINYEVAIER